MYKKILICGGAGHVGGYLTDLLIENGYNVTVYDNLTYESRYMKDIPFIHGDIRDKKKLLKIMNNFDAVVWLAALVGDGACRIDVPLTYEVNYQATKWLAENYKGKIIFTSTCSVYGISKSLVDESAKPNPLSTYAITKLKAEKEIIKNSKNYLILRLGTLFGISDQHSRIRLDLVVNILTKKAALNEGLTIRGKNQWRPLLHVKDTAEAILFALKNDVSGLYNLSYKNFRIFEIGEAINKVIPKIKIKYLSMDPKDIRNYRATAKKFARLGWKPKYDIGYGIREIYKIIQEKRIKEINDNIYLNYAFLRKTIDET